MFRGRRKVLYWLRHAFVKMNIADMPPGLQNNPFDNISVLSKRDWPFDHAYNLTAMSMEEFSEDDERQLTEKEREEIRA